MPGLGDVRIHLEARKLAALTGFGALGHLDLDVGGVDQVVAGDAEAAGGDLLDGAAAFRVVETVDILTALAGVGPSAEVVHGDGHGFVGLGGDGAVTHRAGVESGDDGLDRFDFLQRHRRPQALLELEQSPQGAALLGQAVHLVGVLLEDLVAAGAGRMLQQEHHFRGEQVQLALAAEGVFAADLEAAVHALGRVLRVGPAVAQFDLLGDHVQPGAAELGWRAGEVLVDDVLVDADRLEGLRGGVGGDGGDAHLAHHLHHALAERLEVVAHGRGGFDAGEFAFADQVLDGLEGQIRVDRRGAEADEHRDVVHLAGVTRFDDQRHGGALLGADQVVMHRGDGQQRRDRRPGVVGVAVRDNQCACAFGDRIAGALPQIVESVGEALTAAFDVVEGLQHGGLEAGVLAVVVDVDDLVELVVVEYGPAQHDLPAGRGGRLEEVLLGSHDAGHRGDDLFADGVQRRVGHLGEEFDEVVVEQPGPLGQHGARGVGAHRAQRLGTRCGHRGEQDAEVFFGVAEGDLAAHDGLVVGLDADAVGQRLEVEQAGVQPFPVGLLLAQVVLDLVVGDDAALRGVDQEHLAGLKPALGHDLGGRHVEHAAFAGQDDAIVDGAPPAARP